jgi:hypothetical protein
MQGRSLSSLSVLMPVGRCWPNPARSSAYEEQELLHAFAGDLEEHHEPRGERSTPQQNFYRFRHAISPKNDFSNT